MAKMTRQEILDRFEEAIYTLKKLPPVTMPRCKSFWPDIIYSPLEILQQEPRHKIAPLFRTTLKT